MRLAESSGIGDHLRPEHELASEVELRLQREQLQVRLLWELALAGGERLVLHLDKGVYADTFGRIHFVLPEPPPKSPDAALTALGAQASAQVRTFAPAQQAALFARLEQDKKVRLEAAQDAFTVAAEDILRDAGSDAVARRAARHFLLFSVLRNQWDVDALEKPRPTPSANHRSNQEK